MLVGHPFSQKRGFDQAPDGRSRGVHRRTMTVMSQDARPPCLPLLCEYFRLLWAL